MQLKLVVVAGETREEEISLDLPAVIGRSKDVAVSLGHPLVSRRHCQITWGQQGSLVVEDLGSLNGTYVGKTRISTPVCLEPGGLLTVGEVTFQAIYGEPPGCSAEGVAFDAAACETDAPLDVITDEALPAHPPVNRSDEELQDFLQSL